jgi:hypothetical protein
VTLRPIGPLRGDISRVDVVVSVQGYRGREEGALESFLKVGIVERRQDTKSIKKQTGVTYSHPTIKQKAHVSNSYDRSSAWNAGGTANFACPEMSETGDTKAAYSQTFRPCRPNAETE